MNYKLGIAYNGTNYHGWSIQPNNITVQSIITDALKELFSDTSFAINASGRTDAGVHALDQVLNIKSKKINLNPTQFQKALQSKLPRDISINYCVAVDDNFHARYSCKDKTYLYLINTKPKYDPINHTNIYQYNKPINLKCIDLVQQKLLGTHDFLSFSTSELSDTVRTITDISYIEDGGLIKISITGNGFLRSMVRMIVGTIILLNENKLSENDIDDLLNNPIKGKAQYKAPACGLYLKKVNY